MDKIIVRNTHGIVGNIDDPLERQGEGMLKMNQIDHIKELQRQGTGPKEIGKRLSLDQKTIAKYMTCNDFGQKGSQKSCGGSRLDPFRAKIDEWLEENRRMRFKPRHTAKRVHERLGKAFPGSYDCSHPLVRRYMKACKAERGKEGPRFDANRPIPYLVPSNALSASQQIARHPAPSPITPRAP